MLKRFYISSLLLMFALTSGCAHVISEDMRKSSNLSLSLSQAQQAPEAFKGSSVVWGGEIIQTLNQKDGTTLLEVFQRPLGWRGEPKGTLASEGRFLALAEKYLDPYIFTRGRRVTIAGEILGEEIKPLGEMDYHYPLLRSKQIYLWEEYYYSYYPVPPYYYPYPFYYYYPGWGYPYGWRFRHRYPY